MEHQHVPEPSARPTHAPQMHEVKDKHPEEVDPLGKMHVPPSLSKEERRISSLLTIALVAVIFLVPIAAAISDSPMLNVLLGFSPLIITLILDIIATRQHYKPIVFWVLLAIVHIVGLAVLYLINPLLSIGLNVPSAIAVSAILGVIVTALCTLQTKEIAPAQKHVVAFKPEKLSEYVQSIEDKIKGMNFVIGRVYRTSNGASAKMRERLRVPSEWYNEFHAIKPEDIEEQQEKAKVLLTKIHDRLKTYAMKEKEVFSTQELASIKHLARHKDGEDTIIDVLKTNDRDPVDNYYVSAVEFCNRILEELNKLNQQ
jgi:hypothetical protein